jgi:Sec-independent protein secretion pathway component TatC
LLYELSIIAVRMVERRRTQAEAEEEAAEPPPAASKVDASG